MAMNMLLRRMEVRGITVHGFRSSFRDWVGEKTDYPFHVAEQALAHSLPNAVQIAYLRSDFVEKRTEMMRDWARFIYSPPAPTN
jgi:integrase